MWGVTEREGRGRGRKRRQVAHVAQIPHTPISPLALFFLFLLKASQHTSDAVVDTRHDLMSLVASRAYTYLAFYITIPSSSSSSKSSSNCRIIIVSMRAFADHDTVSLDQVDKQISHAKQKGAFSPKCAFFFLR